MTPLVTRSVTAATALFTLCQLGCAVPGAPKSRAVRLGVTSARSAEAMPFEIAIGAGYLRDEGLTLTIVELPTRDALDRMKAGTLDAAVVDANLPGLVRDDRFVADALVTRTPDTILIEPPNQDGERSVALVRALSRAQRLVHDERAEALHAARAGSDEIDPLVLTQRLDAAIPKLPMSPAIEDGAKLAFSPRREIAARAMTEGALGQRRRRYWTGVTIGLSLAIGAAILGFIAHLIRRDPRAKDEPEP